MSPADPLILRVHVPGAEPYEIGDEIWQQSLAEAITAEAHTIADDLPRPRRRPLLAHALPRRLSQRPPRSEDP